jgi:hypothetical protein
MLGCRQTRRQSRSARAACGALLGPVAFAFVLAFVVGCAPTPATSATVRVTPTSVPTATAMPCPTPAGTTSATQTRLAAAVAAAVGSVPCLDTAYQPRDHTALVTVTIGGLVPTTPTAIAAAQERAKVLSFQAQRALWTSGVSLTGATVAVLGPYLDPYNGPTIAPYTSAYLTAHTAATFAWANLSPDTAWTKYNSTFLRPGFAPADGVPTPTPTA